MPALTIRGNSFPLLPFRPTRGGKIEGVRQAIRVVQLTLFIRASTGMVGRFEGWSYNIGKDGDNNVYNNPGGNSQQSYTAVRELAARTESKASAMVVTKEWDSVDFEISLGLVLRSCDQESGMVRKPHVLFDDFRACRTHSSFFCGSNTVWLLCSLSRQRGDD